MQSRKEFLRPDKHKKTKRPDQEVYVPRPARGGRTGRFGIGVIDGELSADNDDLSNHGNSSIHLDAPQTRQSTNSSECVKKDRQRRHKWTAETGVDDDPAEKLEVCYDAGSRNCRRLANFANKPNKRSVRIVGEDLLGPKEIAIDRAYDVVVSSPDTNSQQTSVVGPYVAPKRLPRNDALRLSYSEVTSHKSLSSDCSQNEVSSKPEAKFPKDHRNPAAPARQRQTGSSIKVSDQIIAASSNRGGFGAREDQLGTGSLSPVSRSADQANNRGPANHRSGAGGRGRSGAPQSSNSKQRRANDATTWGSHFHKPVNALANQNAQKSLAGHGSPLAGGNANHKGHAAPPSLGAGSVHPPRSSAAPHPVPQPHKKPSDMLKEMLKSSGILVPDSADNLLSREDVASSAKPDDELGDNSSDAKVNSSQNRVSVFGDNSSTPTSDGDYVKLGGLLKPGELGRGSDVGGNEGCDSGDCDTKDAVVASSRNSAGLAGFGESEHSNPVSAPTATHRLEQDSVVLSSVAQSIRDESSRLVDSAFDFAPLNSTSPVGSGESGDVILLRGTSSASGSVGSQDRGESRLTLSENRSCSSVVDPEDLEVQSINYGSGSIGVASDIAKSISTGKSSSHNKEPEPKGILQGSKSVVEPEAADGARPGGVGVTWAAGWGSSGSDVPHKTNSQPVISKSGNRIRKDNIGQPLISNCEDVSDQVTSLKVTDFVRKSAKEDYPSVSSSSEFESEYNFLSRSSSSGRLAGLPSLFDSTRRPSSTAADDNDSTKQRYRGVPGSPGSRRESANDHELSLLGHEMAEMVLGGSDDEDGLFSGRKSERARPSPSPSPSFSFDAEPLRIAENWEDFSEGNAELFLPIAKKIATESEQPFSICEPIDYYSSARDLVRGCGVDADEDRSALNHVLEISGFNPSAKPDELIRAMNGFGCSMFRILWVDNEHALAVFNSASSARSALGYSLDNPVLVLGNLNNAAKQSKEYAANNFDKLQPFSARPETNASLARRMVEGHLGVRSAVTPEKRRSEAKYLAEAKEKKEWTAKQRLDMWDGLA